MRKAADKESSQPYILHSSHVNLYVRKTVAVVSLRCVVDSLQDVSWTARRHCIVVTRGLGLFRVEGSQPAPVVLNETCFQQSQEQTTPVAVNISDTVASVSSVQFVDQAAVRTSVVTSSGQPHVGPSLARV